MKYLFKLNLWLLKREKLSSENKAEVLNVLLDKIQALPIKDIISFNHEGTVLVNGKELSAEQAINLREGAVALQRNGTYRIIKDQIAFEAVKMGVHSSVTLDMVIFAKAAIWIQQQESKLVSELTGEIV